jgi:hypothetical protein
MVIFVGLQNAFWVATASKLPANRHPSAVGRDLLPSFPQAPTSCGLQIQKVFGRLLGYSLAMEDASETLSGLVVDVEIRWRSGGERRQMLQSQHTSWIPRR